MPRAKKVKLSNNEMINCYELKKVQKFLTKSINPCYADHHIKVSFRGIVIGATGSGKTNFLMNFISKMKNTFNHIYIYTRAEEALYNFFISQIPKDLLTVHYSLDELKNFSEDKYYGQSLMILDDMVNEKDQTCIQEMFIRGRKIAGGISLLYLTQSYFKVPKIVRSQCQYVFILKILGRGDLNLILKENSLVATKEQLFNMYNYCCMSGGLSNLLLVDLESTQDKTYRRNFKEYLNPSNF
mgnify:CR=1 FL=1